MTIDTIFTEKFQIFLANYSLAQRKDYNQIKLSDVLKQWQLYINIKKNNINHISNHIKK